jgi:nucleoside-diphosphate-sugar epimerase
MSTVLLTGASGFLGLHILKLLVEHGYNVVAIVRSPSKAKVILDVIKPLHSRVRISYVPTFLWMELMMPTLRNIRTSQQ